MLEEAISDGARRGKRIIVTMNPRHILSCIAAYKRRSCTGILVNEGREKLWLQNPVICHCSRGRAALEVFALFSGAEGGRISRA